MSEAIPLRAALRVQGVGVVVGKARGEGLDGVLKGLTVEGGNGRDIEREAREGVSVGLFGRMATYLRLTMSPSVMSLAAAATLARVKRLSRPSCVSSDRLLPGEFLILPDHHYPKPMLCFRQRPTQIFTENCKLRAAQAVIYINIYLTYAPSGAFSIFGRSPLDGKLVAFGSHGIPFVELSFFTVEAI